MRIALFTALAGTHLAACIGIGQGGRVRHTAVHGAASEPMGLHTDSNRIKTVTGKVWQVRGANL